MDEIFARQAALQSAYADKTKMLDPSTSLANVGDALDYIKSMQSFANMELEELLIEIGGSTKALKPWSSEYGALRARQYSSTSTVRSEAIDFLCFAINICLAAGVTKDNLSDEYAAVLSKNKARQLDASY